MNQPTPSQAEEIDLLALAERALVFFRKYRWIFLVAVIVGLSAGYLTFRKLPTVYKSRMILHSFTLSNEDLIQVLDNYNHLLKKHEEGQVAAAFKMSVEDLRKVKQIKSAQIQKVFTPNNPNGFYIDVFVTDNSVLEKLQAGIVNGMENIDFLKRQLSIRKENMRLLIAEVEKEIRKLDSTKSTVERSLASRSAGGSSMIVDISGINKQLIEMNEKLLGYKQDIQFVSAVQVLQGFSAFNLPAGPNKTVWLGLGLLAGLLAGYVIAIYLSIRSKLKYRLKEKQLKAA